MTTFPQPVLHYHRKGRVMTHAPTLLHYSLEKPACLQHAHAASESVSEKRVVVSADLRLRDLNIPNPNPHQRTI